MRSDSVCKCHFDAACAGHISYNSWSRLTHLSLERVSRFVWLCNASRWGRFELSWCVALRARHRVEIINHDGVAFHFCDVNADNHPAYLLFTKLSWKSATLESHPSGKMNVRTTSMIPTVPSNDMVDLHRVIQQLAERCQLDLGNPFEVRLFREGDFSVANMPVHDASSCQTLRTMLTLQLRLESSSSEDMGIEGVNFLWHQCRHLLGKFCTSSEVVEASPRVM